MSGWSCLGPWVQLDDAREGWRELGGVNLVDEGADRLIRRYLLGMVVMRCAQSLKIISELLLRAMQL